MMRKQLFKMAVIICMLLNATFTYANTCYAEEDRFEVKQEIPGDSLSSSSFSKSKIRNRKAKKQRKSVKARKWPSKLIESIIKVESKGDKKAYSKGCAGCMQISKAAVKDANEWLKMHHQKKRFSMSDRFNKQKSIEIFEIEQERYNKEHSIEKAIRIWNGGHNSSKSRTNHYYHKVMKEYRK